MTDGNNRYICLMLADKSLYSLYKSGQSGDKKITLTPAVKGQEKNKISLFDCTGGKKSLLRDILIENIGDLTIHFSLSHEYLSYQVLDESGEIIDKGLCELIPEEEAFALGQNKEGDRIREKRRPRTPWPVIFLSVLITLGFILFVSYSISHRAESSILPPLSHSEMTPR
jgi:hypothetical protein